MRDPYVVLGVSKSASDDEIKAVYRKLAKKLHPDLNPGRKDIESKFKEVASAYDLLSDKKKRARFDRGEIDADGNDRGFAGAGADPYGAAGGPGGGGRWRGQSRPQGGNPFSGMGGAEDLFEEFMRGARGGGGAGNPQPGAGSTVYNLKIPFTLAALGGKTRVTLDNNKTIDVNIPTGIIEGHKLRLRGQGLGGSDAIVEIGIEAHPYFTRKDNDILLEAPVSLPEAILGDNITVPTLDGEVQLRIPKGANDGTTLRLKGKGIATSKTESGDMYVKIRVALPETISSDLSEFFEKWSKKNAYNPRKKLGWP